MKIGHYVKIAVVVIVTMAIVNRVSALKTLVG